MGEHDRVGGGRASLALSRLRPGLWHCAFMGAWAGIQAYGLQSATRLVDLAKLPTAQGQELIRAPRPTAERLGLPNGGQAILRDQHPLHSRRLAHHLNDVSAEEWLHLLNARVFLFTHQRHAQELAEVYSAQGQDVLKLKTASLLAAYEDQVEVTTINSGALPRTAQPSRGRDTFVPLAAFPAERVAAIQEVTILGGIDRIVPFVTSVVRHRPDGSKHRVWP